MKWAILAEMMICTLFFAGGLYSTITAKSADEGIIAAPLYLGGAAMLGVIFLTLLGWWMWQVTFRG